MNPFFLLCLEPSSATQHSLELNRSDDRGRGRPRVVVVDELELDGDWLSVTLTASHMNANPVVGPEHGRREFGRDGRAI